MAGDWIKMRTDLGRCPQVVRISSALETPRLQTVGGLHALWSLADEQTGDGLLANYTFALIDAEIRWEGFCAAVAAVGWLQETPQGVVLPDFAKHNGQSGKRRAQDRDRKRDVRKVSASDADEIRTREEKRRDREEQQQQAPAAAGAAAAEVPTPAAAPPAQPASGPVAVPPSEADVVQGISALVDRGCTTATARTLAAAHPPAVISAIVARMATICREEGIANPDGLARSLAKDGVSLARESRVKVTPESLKKSFAAERAAGQPKPETFEEMKARLERQKAAAQAQKRVDFSHCGEKARRVKTPDQGETHAPDQGETHAPDQGETQGEPAGAVSADLAGPDR